MAGSHLGGHDTHQGEERGQQIADAHDGAHAEPAIDHLVVEMTLIALRPLAQCKKCRSNFTPSPGLVE